MSETQFRFYCPIFRCKFVTNVTCPARIDRARRNHLPAGLRVYENPYGSCVACTGPKAIRKGRHGNQCTDLLLPQ